MKKSLILASLLLASSSAMADGYYIGASKAITGSIDSTISADYSSASVDGDYDVGLIKFGYITNSDNRLEFSVEDTDGLTAMNFDFIATYPNHKFNNITPYLIVGMGTYEVDNSAQYFIGNENWKGVSFNYGVGGVYSITSNFEVEASIRAKSIKMQDIVAGSTTLSTTGSATYTSIGFNYKF